MTTFCFLLFHITLALSELIYYEYLSDIHNTGWECTGTCTSPNGNGVTGLNGGSYAVKTIDITDYQNLTITYQMNKGSCKSTCLVEYQYNTHHSVWTIIGFFSGYSTFNSKQIVPTWPQQTTSITIKLNAPNSCTFTRIGLNGTKVTTQPTTNPTANPSTSPTETPTIHPTSYPSLFPTESPTISNYGDQYDCIHNMLCVGLDQSIAIIYDIDLNDCLSICTNNDECLMVNYFEYFKTNNDSRCYLFDELCTIKADGNSFKNTNRSMICHEILNEECMNYPLDWKDSIGDTCNYYLIYNWCNAGKVLRNNNEFDDLMDSRYGLTAIESCCECGGGIYIIDDVGMSYDHYWLEHEHDIVCGFEPELSTFKSQLSSLKSQLSSLKSQTYTNWDNLMLYKLCRSAAVDSSFDCLSLLDTEFIPDANDLYSIFVCNYNISNLTNYEYEFITEEIIDKTGNNHELYINTLWFIIDTSFYSSSINIHFMDYSQCVDNILIANMDNYNNSNYQTHGIHPCFVLEPTLNPTVLTFDPTSVPSSYPTLVPTINPTFYPTSDPSSNPTFDPTINPSFNPTIAPTVETSANPTTVSTSQPTFDPLISLISTSSLSFLTTSTADNSDKSDNDKPSHCFTGSMKNDKLIILLLIAAISICGLCSVSSSILLYRQNVSKSELKGENNQIELQNNKAHFNMYASTDKFKDLDDNLEGRSIKQDVIYQ